MKIRTLVAYLLLLALPAAVAVPQTPYAARTVVLAESFEMDGEAADADQVVTVAAITDSTAYTIVANPDVCRLVDITTVDGDDSITAGTLTILGTDCWGYPLRVTFALVGAPGVLTGTVADFDAQTPARASGAYFATITNVDTGVVTGEDGADTVTVGYTSNSALAWRLYGRQSRRPDGSRFVDILGQYDVPQLVTNGAATTDIVAVAAATTAPFQNVSIGDFLHFNINGQQIVRRVVTRADADTITVSPGVTIAAAGVNFSYRKAFLSTDPIDGWINVAGYGVFSAIVEVDANTSTGGVVSSVQCAVAVSEDQPNGNVVHEVDTDTVASTATGTAATSVILRELPHYTHCRVGVRFGTGDDDDTGAENIDIAISLAK